MELARTSGVTAMSENIELMMPIKATPYDHQKRPILRGRDIKRYTYEFADLWIIATFPSRHYDIDDYPSVRDYLLSIGIERLEQTGKKHIVDGVEIKARKKTSNKWFETQDSISYWDDFSKQKIVWGEISDTPKFALDKYGRYTTDVTTFIMVGKSLHYLYAFLNSNLSQYYYARIGTTTGVGTIRWKKFKVEQLPVPQISTSMYEEFNGIINQLLFSIEQQKDISKYVEELNLKIYQLLGLTKAEIDFIEQYCNH